MVVDIQEQNGSIVVIIDDSQIEFSEADLARLGINANIAVEILNGENLEQAFN